MASAPSEAPDGERLPSRDAFPPAFVWGAATAAFQIEGATTADGRGASIWDVFCAEPGNVANGDTGEPACEHYVRWRDDVELMASLGLGAYRFSIAWPRVQPDGSGAPNQKGLDFYRQLVEGLLERGIRPFATLYHWDLPQALQEQGGWESREVAKRFGDYAEIAFESLGDLVKDWITHNEPWVQSIRGYAQGAKAPKIARWDAGVRAAHHLLLSHGWVVDAYRRGGGDGRIGITLDLTQTTGDTAAAQRLDGCRNRWFLDPLLRGSYPSDMVNLYAPHVPDFDELVQDGDLATIAAPLDFLGVNYYHPTRVYDSADDSVLGYVERPEPPLTAMGWEVQPAALTTLLTRIKRDYPDVPPIHITENGAAYPDEVRDGAVDDAERLAYVQSHIAALGDAIARGVDVRGYFLWSLLDNFEWERGYDKRFGIVHVDYGTQQRTVKRSGLWYAGFIEPR